MGRGVTETEASPRAAEKPARERLLDAADALFYRRGIRSVGVDEVIAEAGVAKMSLYRSFLSKDELVAAYLERRDAAYWAWWDKVVARHRGDPRAQLLALFDGIARVATRPQWRGCPFTNAATEFPDPDHPGRRVADANKRELRRRFEALAADAGAADPQALADGLVLLAEGAYSSGMTFGPHGPAASLAAAAAALLDACGHPSPLGEREGPIA
jgi:AcrR family transcriptional regulator